MKAYEKWHATYTLHKAKKLSGHQEEEPTLRSDKDIEQTGVLIHEPGDTRVTPFPLISNGDERQPIISRPEPQDTQATLQVLPNGDGRKPDVSTLEPGDTKALIRATESSFNTIATLLSAR